jgi:LPXTG-motif cell wall-anchored protein
MNEGFAIAEAGFTKDGQRPVYRFKDGEKFGSLSIGFIASDYKENVDDNSGNTGNEGTVITGKPVWQQGTDKDLVIIIDVEHTKFKNLYLNNENADEKMYTLVPGSTKITILNSYLKTLPEGEHTVGIEFTDGIVNTTLSIVTDADSDDQKPDPTTPNNDQGNKDDTVNNGSQKVVEKNNTEGNNKLPNTSTPTYNLIVLGLLIMIAGAVLYMLARKKEVL